MRLLDTKRLYILCDFLAPYLLRGEAGFQIISSLANWKTNHIANAVLMLPRFSCSHPWQVPYFLSLLLRFMFILSVTVDSWYMLASFKITILGSLIKTVLSYDLLWIYCSSFHRSVPSLLTASGKMFNSTESMELHHIVVRSVTISTKEYFFMPKPSRNVSSANLSMLSVEIHR